MSEIAKFCSRGNQTVTFYATGKRNKVSIMSKFLHYLGLIILFRMANDPTFFVWNPVMAMPVSRGNSLKLETKSNSIFSRYL